MRSPDSLGIRGSRHLIFACFSAIQTLSEERSHAPVNLPQPVENVIQGEIDKAAQDKLRSLLADEINLTATDGSCPGGDSVEHKFRDKAGKEWCYDRMTQYWGQTVTTV
ncbi:hypothetical protein K9N68_09540 [Kovacikia minuta CCNUW1]|uniref:hypothetical protein n=1 Tax=Kovacikia minuta TaxID=2931930 RepID=UPI001CCA491C|nr:hypothetical protein [Kovacikia minuta]UBF28099.1 hypothetical protein K9N68_09540 [Kovacikia minuta CCNUW1]